MNNKIEYNEVSKAKISKSRNVVISSCSKGGYTIAQQLEAQEDGKSTCVFLKGALHIDNYKGLYELRDAINLAIKIEEEKDLKEDTDKKIEESW
jgi:hypothetical protein